VSSLSYFITFEAFESQFSIIRNKHPDVVLVTPYAIMLTSPNDNEPYY
jgi:hypothetical protein